MFPQVTRIVLLWVNNHFNDFEGDPAMTRFLEEFEKNLEDTVRLRRILSSSEFRDSYQPPTPPPKNSNSEQLSSSPVS